MKQLRIAVLGDGGWGTTLAMVLSRKNYAVTLWSAFADYAKILDAKRVNERYLPGIAIPRAIAITSDLATATGNKDVIILSVPSEYMRGVARKIRTILATDEERLAPVFLSVSKGIETVSLKRVSEIIHEELGRVRLGVLSGPTIAREVALGVPTVAVIASTDPAISARLQAICMTPKFPGYTNTDIIGVELGGSLKNVIAIGCGIADGLKFGTNAKAALLARGLAEIARLGHTLGANVRTFSGLSGLGDLVTTCISPYSRNRSLGEQIGKGKSVRDITAHTHMVAEGLPTAKSAYALSLKHNVEMPITREVYRVLYKGKSPLKALNDLMTREKKAE